MLTDIQEFVMSNPELVVGLTVLVTIGVHYQKGLTYREYRFIHIGKCWAFYALNSWASKRGRPLVRTIGEDSFVMSVDENPRSVYSTLSEEFSPHLIATAKKAEDGSWSHSQLVQFHDDKRQTEAVLFSNPDGTTDVFGHLETSVTDPDGHVSDAQEPGDPLGAIQNVLED